MELRERKKHISGELGMSSMTDILFILLMFFMMISALAAPSALNLQMPGKSNKANRIADNKRLTEVSILRDGSYRMDGRTVSIEQVQAEFAKDAARSGSTQANVVISPSNDAPNEYVVAVMDAAVKAGVMGVLSLEDN